MFDPKVHVGTAAVLTRFVEGEEQVLLLHRVTTATHGGDTWGLPGGWIDWGQQPIEACAREVLEEANIVVDEATAEFIDAVANTYEDHDMHVVCINILFRDYDGSTMRNMEPRKCDEIRWVPLAELTELKLFPPFESAAREWGWL